MKQTVKIGCRVLVALLCLAMLASVISVPTFAADTPSIPSSLAGSDLDFLMDMLEQYNKVKNDEDAAEQMKEYVEDKYNSDESFKESADNLVGGGSTEEGEENKTLENMNSVIENVFKEEFTIKWDVNGTIYESTNVPYGEKPAFPGNEEALSYEINDYRYIFSGWTPVVVAAKADATYTAVFSVENVAAVGTLTVTFVTGKGSFVEKFDSLVEAEAYADTLDTDKPEDANFTYTFKEWTVVETAETATFTAQYDKAEKSKGWSDILTSGKVVEDYFGSIDEVMDAVQNGATVEDLKESVQHQQKVEQEKAEAEEKGEVYIPEVYNVTWILDGKQVGEPVSYDYKKLIKQPTITGISAGKYVSWDMTYVLMPAQDIVIYGETVDIVETIVNEINGLPMNYGEYEMTYADGVATLYINVDASNYDDILRDVLGDVRGGTAQSAYKEAVMAFLQTAAMEMYNSKTNTIDVNGYEVFGIDGYGASQLVELLNTVKAGNYGEIVSVSGLKQAILTDPVTPTDIANIGDDGLLSTYDITLGATGKQDFNVEFRLALKGDLNLIRKSADAILATTDYIYGTGGDLHIEIFVPAAFTQVLTEALNSASIDDETKLTIVAGLDECATVGELMDLFDLLDYDQFIEVMDSLLEKLPAESEQEKALIEKLKEMRPAFDLFKEYGNILIEKAPESLTGKQASVTFRSVYELTQLVTYDDLVTIAQLKKADALAGNAHFTDAVARVATKFGISTARAQEIVERMADAFANYQENLPESTKAKKIYNGVNDLIDLVYNKIPENFRDTKLTDTYKGNGEFSFEFSKTYNPGAWLQNVLSDVKISAYGVEIVLGDYIPARDITSEISFELHIADLYSVTYMVEDAVAFEGFLPFGAELAPYVTGYEKEGYTLVWVNEYDEELTTMPGEDTVLYAKYIAEEYTITFVDEDDTVLYTGPFTYNTIPVYPYANPEKADTNLVDYTFLGWEDAEGNLYTGDLPAAVADATYKAVYEEMERTYTITFNILGQLYYVGYAYGETPYYDASLSYLNFAGWQGYGYTLPPVTGNATYVAEYTANVSFYADGQLVASYVVPYGTVPPTPAAPAKGMDLDYSYGFAGWYQSDGTGLTAATAHAVYQARYTAYSHFGSDVNITREGNLYTLVLDAYVQTESRVTASETIPSILFELARTHPEIALKVVAHAEEEVEGAHAVTILLDNKALLNIKDNATQNEITIGVSSLIAEEEECPTFGDYYAVYSFDLIGSAFDGANGGTAIVTVPFEETHKFHGHIYYLNGDAAPVELDVAESETELNFTTSHFSYYAVNYKQFLFTIEFLDKDGNLLKTIELNSDEGQTLTVADIPELTEVAEPTAEGHFVASWKYGSKINVDPVKQFEQNPRDYTFQESHDIAEHTYGEYEFDDDNHWRTCSVCGFVETEEHTYVDGVCVCGHTIPEETTPEETTPEETTPEETTPEETTPEETTPEETTPEETTPDDETTAPDDETTAPDDETTAPDDETTTPGGDGTSVPGSSDGTEDPGESSSEEESTTDVAGEKGNKNGWWIFLIILLVFIAILIVAYILYGHKLFPKNPAPEAAPAEPEQTEVTDAEIVADHAVEAAPELEEIHIVEHVAAAEVDELMSDAQAVHAVELVVAEAASGKMGAVNVGVLNQHFEAGEKVDIDVLKAKKLIDADCKRVKILADGDLDKALVVEAHSFSLQAIKMITLTGGHALKLQATAPADKADEK